MTKLIPAYFTMMLVMFMLDLIWLSMLVKPIYQQGIGHLMAHQPNLIFAGLFYVVYVLGLVRFALLPNKMTKGCKATFIASAIFGFFVYASYDLTNLALLNNWPLGMSIIDVTWGTLLSGVSAAAGKMMLDWSHST